MADAGNPLSLTGKLFIGLFVSYAVILLIAVWFEAFDSAVFIKLTITYAVAIVVLAIVYLVRREFIDDEQAKKDKFMD
jgi:uncharacterized membrane protein YcjF (UPF0283 family)